mgnify:CR=1 FL=1
MFKKLSRQKGAHKDVRFVRFEDYKSNSPNSPNSSNKENSATLNHRSKAGSVGLPKAPPGGCDRSYSVTGSIQWSTLPKPYQVDHEEINYENIDTPIFVEKNDLEFNGEENNFPFSTVDKENFSKLNRSTKTLGIFSDTRMYSALIKSELERYSLNIKHFNHPKTFVASKYPYFDGVSAWIVFLSDDCDNEFLDKFIDRYVDKPTLFLCPKTNRLKTSQKIYQFVCKSGLETVI